LEADRAVYRVKDNGVGIAENHIAHVFELFHRLEPEKIEGDGLGLTIVRQALSRMYGEIRVESEIGRGSVFIVSMPQAPKRNNSRE
jgi:signal transduction histidine kinase